MNSKTILSGAFMLAAASSLFATTPACDQQAPKCSSARGDFIAKYTYVSGPESCKARAGEKVGLQTYNAVGESGKPDLDRASVAIQADTLGTLHDNAEAGGVTDSDPNDKEYSLGGFNTSTPSNDICVVPQLTIAQQQLGEVAADEENGVSAQPATLINYQWKNVQFLVTAQYYGSQFQADLDLAVDGVDCNYKVQGLYPYVDCHKLDANGDPEVDANGNGIPDDSFCNPEPNPPAHPTGSGINPDFPVQCDPVLFACVLKSSGFPVIQ